MMMMKTNEQKLRMHPTDRTRVRLVFIVQSTIYL